VFERNVLGLAILRLVHTRRMGTDTYCT
jgi:hypothetical protein